MRWLHRGYECPEEEAVVEALADAWRPLSAAERAQIRGEGQKTLLRDPVESGPRLVVLDAQVFAWPGTAPRGLREVA